MATSARGSGHCRDLGRINVANLNQQVKRSLKKEQKERKSNYFMLCKLLFWNLASNTYPYVFLACISGLLQTALYADFFYYYFIR